MQWPRFFTHAGVCGCPPSDERDAIQILNRSHEASAQLKQPVSLSKTPIDSSLLRPFVATDLTASCKCSQAPPYSWVVGTNSPLILLMPELGLLYILSSSDPLCGEKKKETVRNSWEILGKQFPCSRQLL